MDKDTLKIDGLGKIIIANNFFNSLSHEKKKVLRKEILEFVFKGKFIPHFLFGGPAMRLGLGTMYFINIIEVVDSLIKAVDKIESSSSWFRRRESVTPKEQKIYDSFQRSLSESVRPIVIAAIKKIRKQIKNQGLKAKNFGLGASQLIMYRTALQSLAKNEGKSKREILELLNQIPIVIHVNKVIIDRIARDLCVNGFFGFNPANIYILASPVTMGHKMDKQFKFTVDENSMVLPVGDGEALEQINIDGEVYKLNTDGRLEKRKGCLLEILENIGVEIIQAHRINDLGMLDENVVLSIERLMLFKYYSDNNAIDIGFELVENPADKIEEGQGLWLRLEDGRQIIADPFSLKAECVREVLDDAVQNKWSYNSFRNFYNIKRLRKILQNNELRKYMKILDGSFYTNCVTADISQKEDVKTIAFEINNEVGKDFKEMGDILDGSVKSQ